MSLRIFGAVLIVLGCGGFGAILVRNDRLAEKSLRSLCAGLDFMSSELQYRLTPLPDLCRMAGQELGSGVGAVFSTLAMTLEDQISPDVNACMHAALSRNPSLPEATAACFRILGTSLGRFDLEGQLRGLDRTRTECRERLAEFAAGRDQRRRNYRTLSLCAGAALAILFL